MTKVTRRQFVQASAALGLSAAAVRPVWAQSSKGPVRLLGVGVGGRGHADITGTGSHADAKVVGMVDVDTNAYGRIREQFGRDLPAFTDWRQAFKDMADDFDAVTIGTPDHMHAAIALTAMRMGKNVYVEKPMCHTLHETRTLLAASRKHKAIYQMGNQAHSDEKHDRVKKQLQMGAIGKLQRLHAWSNRPIWPQGGQRPQGADPVPSNLHWYEWLGVAESRPYVNDHYHTFKWRGYWDFGTGALGDMGCHIMDVLVDALELNNCLAVVCDPTTPTGYMYPTGEYIKMTFQGTQYTDGNIDMHWYDGGKRPNTETEPMLRKLRGKVRLSDNGRIFVGETGMAVSEHYGDIQWFDLNGEPMTPPTVESSGVNHHHGFVDACLGRDVEHNNRSHFEDACPLTEACLLGALASRFPGKTLKWDSRKLRFTNSQEANKFVHKQYREGWEVEGL